MKAQPNSSLKFLKSIKTAIILERRDIEKQLASKKPLIEKTVTPTKKKKNLAVYKAPNYRNETGPRKEYIIKLGEIEWDCDIYGFNNTFIYETTADPLDFDNEDDTKYGVSDTFYYEIIETLSVDVCEIWNEPELLSITDINGKPISKKTTAPKKTTSTSKKKAAAPKKKTSSKTKNLDVYKAPVYNNDSNPRKQYIIKLDKDIDWGEDVYGFKPTFVYETSTDPNETDDEDDMIYGVSREFYDELIEVLSTSVSEIWNEPEIISIEEV
jgi:hypothetical protein